MLTATLRLRARPCRSSRSSGSGAKRRIQWEGRVNAWGPATPTPSSFSTRLRCFGPVAQLLVLRLRVAVRHRHVGDAQAPHGTCTHPPAPPARLPRPPTGVVLDGHERPRPSLASSGSRSSGFTKRALITPPRVGRGPEGVAERGAVPSSACAALLHTSQLPHSMPATNRPSGAGAAARGQRTALRAAQAQRLLSIARISTASWACPRSRWGPSAGRPGRRPPGGAVAAHQAGAVDGELNVEALRPRRGSPGQPRCRKVE